MGGALRSQARKKDAAQQVAKEDNNAERMNRLRREEQSLPNSMYNVTVSTRESKNKKIDKSRALETILGQKKINAGDSEMLATKIFA